MKRRDLLKVAAVGAVASWIDARARGAEAESPRAPGKDAREEIAWTRKVPVRYEADVAVIGGGIAGVAAACAAAKSGARVVLVERFAIAGGNLTTGGVASFCGETAGQGEVFDEVVADLEKFGAVELYKPYPQADHRVFEHHVLAVVLQEVLLRRKVKLLLHYQRVEAKPWRYDGCSPQIGIREGARIVGDYVLKLEDLRAGRTFDDAVARGVYYLDGHKPDDDKRTYILKKEELKVPPYQIPLRSLIAKDGANLLMAGRCFSGEQLALSSARVSTTCAMMGQAAGLAAALSVQKSTDARKLDPKDVRRLVEERGAVLAL